VKPVKPVHPLRLGAGFNVAASLAPLLCDPDHAIKNAVEAGSVPALPPPLSGVPGIHELQLVEHHVLPVLKSTA
jgi:hypothetical protein